MLLLDVIGIQLFVLLHNLCFPFNSTSWSFSPSPSVMWVGPMHLRALRPHLQASPLPPFQVKPLFCLPCSDSRSPTNSSLQNSRNERRAYIEIRVCNLSTHRNGFSLLLESNPTLLRWNVDTPKAGFFLFLSFVPFRCVAARCASRKASRFRHVQVPRPGRVPSGGTALPSPPAPACIASLRYVFRFYENDSKRFCFLSQLVPNNSLTASLGFAGVSVRETP